MDNPVYFIDPDGQWPTLPSWNDVKRSYNQARASVANAYSQARSSVSRTYSETKTAVTKTYNDTKKTVVETTNKAVASTKETLKDGQKWVKDNKEQLIGAAKEIQKVGDNTTKIGLVGAVAGAPVAGVGAAPGLAVATAGGVVSFVGSGLELGVNLISGEYSTAAGDVAAHAAGEIGGMIVDKAIPGPNPDVAPEITELFKAGKKIIEGQAGDKAKGEVKKVTEQFNKE